MLCVIFFFNDTATTQIYTLSLHDALPISWPSRVATCGRGAGCGWPGARSCSRPCGRRSEEHTSELQSQSNLVCRLLLEKKKYSSTSFTNNKSNVLYCICCTVSIDNISIYP